MARALTCAHGLHICPRCRDAEWPSTTDVVDHEGQVLEAVAKLRDAVRAGDPDTDLLMAVCDAMDELDGLFAGIPDADQLD